MPLTTKSPGYLHFLQNLSLIVLAAILTPLCSLIAILSWIISPYTRITSHIERQRQWRKINSPESQRTVLVTGVGMSKGLTIARAFYRAGHTVIGADFEPYGVPVCGRFSTALKKFHRLATPSGAAGVAAYFTSIVDIVEKEKVDLWVSCSGVATAAEDGRAAEEVEKLTGCKAIQFGASLTSVLHEKHSFVENTKKIGLNVPETHFIISVEKGLQILHPASGKPTKRFIMKSVGLDDSIRADMTVLPFQSAEKTRAHITALRPSTSRPFVLQQFINGLEFCTHSIVVKGRVLAFTCCESAELLMHYKALPPSSDMFKATLKYTQLYAQKMGEQMTGHFSIDFLFNRDELEPDLMKSIYPIECNPRAHTAVVLFAEESQQMADAYLTVLGDSGKHDTEPYVVTPKSNIGCYWIGHDLVTRLLLPFLSFVTLKTGFAHLMKNWTEFFEYIIFWQDGTYELWDPWPAWILYCIYWPGIFLACILTRRKWSRCNVSTTKVFNC